MTSPTYPRINGHGHLLPDPGNIPRFMRDKKLFWIDDDKRFMRQGDWSRPVTDNAFFLDGKLEWLDKHHIQHEVLLTLSQLYANGVNRQDALDMVRFQNDFHAEVQETYPDRFTCGFVVQPLYIEDCLAEIERAVEKLNLKMLCLPTHYIDEEGQWETTAHERLAPIYELASRYRLAVDIHPYDAPRMIKLRDQNWRFHLIWMCAQTADYHHFYTLKNMGDRYPGIRICLAHGNQYGQVNLGRRQRGYEGRPDLFKDMAEPKISVGHPNVFFDSIVHDVWSFELMVKRSGTAQIVAGLDNPYPLGEIDHNDCYPGTVLDDAVYHKVITEAERQDIWGSNVERWLGKEIL